MFGSKFRSWMENHIVRPRKKGNKNKNTPSNNLGTTNNTQNGHKGTGISIYQNDNSNITSTIPPPSSSSSTTTGAAASSTITSNSISSPARRSEVSPIQNHTTSRFGWQSPKHETTTSPKSDHFMYMHTIKAHTLSSTSSLSTNQSGTVPSAASSSSTNSSTLIAKKTKTLSPNIMLRKSSSKTSPSTQDSNNVIGCNQKIHQQSQQQNQKFNYTNKNNINSYTHIQQQHHHNHHQQQQQQQQSHNKFYIHSNNQTNQCYQSNGGSTMQCLMNNTKQNYYDINMHKNNANQKITNKKQGSLSSSSSSQNLQLHQHQQQQQYYQNCGLQHYDENQYGKILPSKRCNFDKFKPSIGSYDNLNANIQFQSATNELDENSISKSNNNNNINNNNIIETMNLSKSNNMSNSNSSIGLPYNIQQTHHQLHHSGQIQLRNGNEQNRNVIRANRYSSNSMLGSTQPPNNHPLAHVINSLSSPESAYSTGYSTDGTSPGATYAPPEYYINIRTGTHYFPKAVNTLAIEANRYRFGLNKIEEMSPQEPLPNNHRRTESFDLTQNKVPSFGIPDPIFIKSKTIQSQQQGNQPSIPQQAIVLPNFKGFESPSPRQRCRIRTNPWYSTTETSSSGSSIFLAKKIEIDASSLSSGVKSSSDAGISDKNEKNEKTTDPDTTSSSTEVDIHQRTFSPGTIRRRKIVSETGSAIGGCGGGITTVSKSEIHVTHSLHQDSDEDATLNEMMGKFDESYVYEKETDILSDSDPTDCPSDLDTGQDAGDECDTDEILDIDFIDTGSIQEIIEKDLYKNSGSCSYFNYQLERRTSRKRRSRKQNEDINNSKRKKRLMKTRKKSIENKERDSPIRYNRESRSLGGTPVSLRRNQSADNKRNLKISPLTNRSSSLTFTEVHSIRGRFVAIAESEKALLKADLEADVKYKQLIHEAETILVSMKTNSALRETNVSSPRRICNPPANKRVEILRNCEADIKREIAKQTSKPIDSLLASANVGIGNDSINSPPSVINKRLEMIKYETNSAPNSPKTSRFSLRKTHITNFINQNAPPPPSTPPPLTTISSSIELTSGKNSMKTTTDLSHHEKSFHIQSNRSLKSPSNSPSIRRRVRSQSPRIAIDSDSDTEDDQNKRSPSIATTKVTLLCKQKHDKPTENTIILNDNHSSNYEMNKNIISRKVRQKIRDLKDDLNNKNVELALEKMSLYDELDYTNRNNIFDTKKLSLMSFKSIDMGKKNSLNISYCPQSEPLKRKIYKGSSSFERLKKSLDLESEIPKQALLEKISNLRKERQAMKGSNPEMNYCSSVITTNSQELMTTMLMRNNGDDLTATATTTSTNTMLNTSKHQLILNTIEDLKRSLEDQSVELCGLNDNSSTEQL